MGRETEVMRGRRADGHACPAGNDRTGVRAAVDDDPVQRVPKRQDARDLDPAVAFDARRHLLHFANDGADGNRAVSGCEQFGVLNPDHRLRIGQREAQAHRARARVYVRRRDRLRQDVDFTLAARDDAGHVTVRNDERIGDVDRSGGVHDRGRNRNRHALATLAFFVRRVAATSVARPCVARIRRSLGRLFGLLRRVLHLFGQLVHLLIAGILGPHRVTRGKDGDGRNRQSFGMDQDFAANGVVGTDFIDAGVVALAFALEPAFTFKAAFAFKTAFTLVEGKIEEAAVGDLGVFDVDRCGGLELVEAGADRHAPRVIAMRRAPCDQRVEDALVDDRYAGQPVASVRLVFIDEDHAVAHADRGRVVDQGKPEASGDADTVDSRRGDRAGLTVFHVGQRRYGDLLLEFRAYFGSFDQNLGRDRPERRREITREREGLGALPAAVAAAAGIGCRTVVAVAHRLGNRIGPVTEQVRGQIDRRLILVGRGNLGFAFILGRIRVVRCLLIVGERV